MRDAKRIVAGLLLGAGGLACGQAFADTTGTVAATSEYLFRGVEQENGAAVQGSLTWNNPGGFYVGAWASNAAIAGGNELDIYGGWTTELGNGLSLDLGVIYYLYSEAEETPGSNSLDYPEVYAGLSFGGLSGKVFYAADINDEASEAGTCQANLAALGFVGASCNNDQEGIYATLSYALTVKEGLDLTFQVGHSTGDGVENLMAAGFYTGSGPGNLNAGDDDSYTDYSITLSKDLGNGMGASFAFVDTDLEAVDGTGNTVFEDDGKFVVSFSKEFAL
ncbi:MAG: TorF family putative porin [Nevskiales bacterium]